MDRIVVSAQRSGLNWLRFCIEHSYGRRTPGRLSIISEDQEPSAVFERTHDALNLSRHARQRGGGTWQKLDPNEAGDAAVLLLLRDPQALFVRMSNRKYGRMRSLVGNIRYYDQVLSKRKHVGYYEDLVRDPAAMLAAMETLDIPLAPDTPPPTLESLSAAWESLGERSRQNYDVKQGGSGGAVTKDAPTDFSFHTKGLTGEETRRIWAFLQLQLTSDQLALLERYFPKEGLPKVTFGDRVHSALVTLRSKG